MIKFTDDNGKEWRFKPLTYGLACVIRDEYGLDVGLMASDDGVNRFLEVVQNPMVVIPAMFELLDGENDPDEFGRCLGEVGYPAAYKAFMEAVIDFFPLPRRAQLLVGIEAAEAKITKTILTWTQQRGGLVAQLESIREDLVSAN